MTREEAIKVIRKMLACTDLSVRANLKADMVDACHLAIKALEQEPIFDKVKQAREEMSDWDVNKVMDGCSEPFKLGVAKGLDIASVILDKLIESEG